MKLQIYVATFVYATKPYLQQQNVDMTDAFAQMYRLYEGLPVVGGFFRRQRRDAERAVSGVIDARLRDSISLDAIVRRIDVGEIVARLDVGEIVARLDVGEIVARLDVGEIVDRLDVGEIVDRLDVGAIVDRLDIDAVVARLDMNEVVAKLDFTKLAKQVVEDVDLPKVIRQAGNSAIRGRRPAE